MAVTRTHFTFCVDTWTAECCTAVRQPASDGQRRRRAFWRGRDPDSGWPASDRVRCQMDNTEVFRVMAEALGLGLSD